MKIIYFQKHIILFVYFAIKHKKLKNEVILKHLYVLR